MHIPGSISSQYVGVNGPDGSYLQIEIAVTACSCGRVHSACADLGTRETGWRPFGNASFQLGVLYSQLNNWEDTEPDESIYQSGEGTP